MGKTLHCPKCGGTFGEFAPSTSTWTCANAGCSASVGVNQITGEATSLGPHRGRLTDDILTNCDGRLLWRCLDGKPVLRTGAFPFLCPKCGASGLASRMRTVCGLPVATDGSDGAWMEWTEGGNGR